MKKSRTRFKPVPEEKGVRPPAVSGVHYPDEERALRESVDHLLQGHRAQKAHPAVAAITPHGGIRSAGPVLAQTLAAVEWPPAAVLVGPNHSGTGAPFGIALRGSWSTPLGSLTVHERLARMILKSTPELARDDRCHEREHAVEVHLPFLIRQGIVRGFVPIALSSCDAETAARIGKGIAQALQKSGEPVLLVATSNLSSYQPESRAAEADPKLLDPILALAPDLFQQVARDAAVGMCGIAPVAAVLTAAKILGARQGRLVRYQTSAETTGVRVSVTGYAGVLLEREGR